MPAGFRNNDTEALEGMRLWKLGDYTTQELKDELGRRERAEEQANDKEFNTAVEKINKRLPKIQNLSKTHHYDHAVVPRTVGDSTGGYCGDCEVWFA